MAGHHRANAGESICSHGSETRFYVRIAREEREIRRGPSLGFGYPGPDAPHDGLEAAWLHTHHRGRIFEEMASSKVDRPDSRAREKQRSREDDARALASGDKSREQLKRENGHFAFANVRVSLRGAKPLE